MATFFQGCWPRISGCDRIYPSRTTCNRTIRPNKKMPYLIGTDEAGYGPNLGPLLISTTVWWVDGSSDDIDLYERLAEVIVTKPRDAGAERLAMADSKVLYKPGKGLRHLERGLFTALALVDRQPRDWYSIWAALDPQSEDDRRILPWHDGYVEQQFPIDAKESELESLEVAMRKTMEAAGVHLVNMRCRAVFPERFNSLCDQSDNKGAVLSNLTLDLLAGAVEPLGYDKIKIICDKHGGRNKYEPLLVEHFPERPIEVREEGRYLSRYEFGPANRRVEISFQAKGESWMPAALASMASKYLRELAMRAFNDFWCSRIEGLKPTAGYPVDAKRFKAEIAEVQGELGIDDRVIWRNR
ncbi:MAG: hypothetical protein JXM70_16315 [Pirellulales bacterium]|nr:hypothetical protein [Pirellulales bacterium]